MSDLLDCLGVSGRWPRRLVAVAIWIGFGGAMVAIAAAQALAEWAIGASTTMIIVFVGLVWVAWSFWHSYLFARHRKSYLASGIRFPYRRAFLCDIFPGITIGFSQMLRPAWNGENLRAGLVPHIATSVGGIAAQVAGLAIFAASFALFLGAWRVLGAARVGFAAEFRDVESFEPVRSGPYGYVRHPLFWSGIGVSCALALLTLTTAGIAIALLNIAYGLVYNVLEDRRLSLVLGSRYESYSRQVPRIIPRRRLITLPYNAASPQRREL